MAAIQKRLGVLLVVGSAAAWGSLAQAAPVYNTFSYIDSFTPGAIASKFNFGVGAIDETYSDGSGAVGDIELTGRARAYASGAGGIYAIGARAELTADYVPGSLIPPTGSFFNTAETLAVGQIQDQLTFNDPSAQPTDFITYSLTYQLSGNGFTCDPLYGCAINYGPGEIGATQVYGEATSSLDSGWTSATKHIDYPMPGGLFTHTFTVLNGSTHDYTLELRARVFSTSEDAYDLGMDGNPGYFAVRGDANYYSTLTLVGIDAFDAQGTPITGFSILNSDGIALAPVPVPAAVWLFGSGLLGFAGLARKLKS